MLAPLISSISRESRYAEPSHKTDLSGGIPALGFRHILASVVLEDGESGVSHAQTLSSHTYHTFVIP